MAIKKRKVNRKKPPIKLSPFARKCQKLYNRLQASDEEAALELGQFAGYKGYAMVPNEIAALLSTHINCEVVTLQLNYPDHVSFRCNAAYRINEERPPTTLRYVSISQTYWQSVMLAYTKLCQMHGEFI